MPVIGAAGTVVTLGAEEEYVLLDPHSGLPVPWAAKVEDAADMELASGGGDVDRELLQAQIEVATPVCGELAELAERLTRLRDGMRRAALRSGCLAAATGAAPLATDTAVPVTPKQRYEDMLSEAALLVEEQLICGMHVHVAVPGRSLGAGALARIRPWLPVLVALGANSPFWQGKDTGFASWRTVVFGRWPASGVPPFAADAAQYEQRVEELLATGVVPDRHQLYWHARLSDTYPTLEVRAADVQLDADSAVTLAGLIRGLVATGLDEVRAGADAPNPPAGILTAAGWHAARHGLTDVLVDPRSGRPAPAGRVAERLYDHVAPALRRFGDHDRVSEGLNRLLDGGTGAVRQRAAVRGGGLPALLDLTAGGTADRT
ncbi:glutamate--cysteine ligase [Streptomyces sp. NPDC087787]|uniref:carboxylate-amine ligase n=1 Tax=Streptomyces sp. NPDC087787 TaxID=3365803 RepID=UPI003803E61D